MCSKFTANGVIAAFAILVLYFASVVERCVGWNRVYQLVSDVTDAASTGDTMRVRIVVMSFAVEIVRSAIRSRLRA